MDNVKYHVLGDQIVQTTTLRPGGGGLVDVYQVPYMIDSGPAAGHVGQVQIASSAFTPDAVKGAVEAAVAAVHNVASISG